MGVAAAQFEHLGVPQEPWRGPLSDHVLGVPPKDTPEVTAAKLALNQAYSQVCLVFICVVYFLIGLVWFAGFGCFA